MQPAVAALERTLLRARTAKDESAGPLRIVGPRSTFLPVVWPLGYEFYRQNPGVRPDVQLDDRVGNWRQDRVDVGFCIGVHAEEGVIARRLFPLQLIVCAAPEYLARHDFPNSLDELALHRCSVFRHPGSGRLLPWSVTVDGEVVLRDIPPALSTNDSELEVEAVLSGQVIGSLANISAATHLRSGRLVPLLTAHATDNVSVFVYYGSRTAQPSRVRAFIDLAIARLTNSPDYVLSVKELAAAEAQGRKTVRQR